VCVPFALGLIGGANADRRDFGSAVASREPLVVFSATTGKMVAGFPRVDPRPLSSDSDAEVNSIVDDGHGGWWVGGRFRGIGNSHCTALAHIHADLTVDRNCPKMKTLPTFFAYVGTLARRKDTLFVGGYFYRINGQRRDGLAAVSNTTGKLLLWNPGSDGQGATSLSLGQHSLYVAGFFAQLGGKKRASLGAVDVQTAKATVQTASPGPAPSSMSRAASRT
jgi:hypothetical protein